MFNYNKRSSLEVQAKGRILTWNKCIQVEKQDFLHERISDKRVSGGVPPSGKTISHCRIQSHAFGKKAHV